MTENAVVVNHIKIQKCCESCKFSQLIKFRIEGNGRGAFDGFRDFNEITSILFCVFDPPKEKEWIEFSAISGSLKVTENKKLLRQYWGHCEVTNNQFCGHWKKRRKGNRI